MRYLLLIALVLPLSSAGCGSGETAIGYESPQAAYDAFAKAGQEGDWENVGPRA